MLQPLSACFHFLLLVNVFLHMKSGLNRSDLVLCTLNERNERGRARVQRRCRTDWELKKPEGGGTWFRYVPVTVPVPVSGESERARTGGKKEGRKEGMSRSRKRVRKKGK